MVTMTRTLWLLDNPSSSIAVRINAPVRKAQDWSCLFEIDWPDAPLAREAIGIDAVQAMQLAFEMIGTNLYMSELHQREQLVWLKPGAGYGFPVPNAIRDLLVGDDRKWFG